jgi:hypothetical protein
MIWILSSIAVILEILFGIWLLLNLPVKYRILEETNELGQTYYYPQRSLLLFWSNFDEFMGYYTLTNICFKSYDEAKTYLDNYRQQIDHDKKSRNIISKRKLTV